VAELDADAVIDRMLEVVEARADIALGAYFGYGTSTVSGWRQRKKVPYAECVILATRKGVSLDWLLLGLGTPYLHGPAVHGVREEGAVGYGADPRQQRMEGFLRHWHQTHDEDARAWMEMQLARAVPEYAEWMAARKG
jgi:hypothetical protein